MRRKINVCALAVLWTLSCIMQPAMGQELPKKPLLTLEKVSPLDLVFSGYELNDIKSTNFKNKGVNPSITLRVSDKKEVDITLNKVDILANNYKVTTADPNSRIISRSELAVPYEGKVNGHPESNVRITLENQYLYGYFIYDDKKYYVEPAKKYDKSLSSSTMVVYSANQVKKNSPVSCAAKIEADEVKEKGSNLKMAGSCQVAELAIAIDYSYRQLHGGNVNAINQTISVMNMVAGVYEGSFSDDIRFEIVEHFVSDCPSCDPWSPTTDAQALLDDFTAWGPTGFSVSHDIGQFWSDRDLCGGGNCSVAGLAWIDAVCGTFRYHILEDFTSTAWQLRVLVSHEMGHNFGANHDASGSTTIMAPSVSNNTTTWSSTSVNVINTSIAGFTCFEECVVGSCTELVGISTSDCSIGDPSTYTLTLEVRHGGGGTSSSFDVIVDGQSYTQSWTTSPQTVIINDLVADGEVDNIITIVADDGSDAGCAGSGVYDAPAADCAISIKADFNDCALPQGWNRATTNAFSWNGGDPLVQFEWKIDDATRQFANYDDQGNAGSLKTIDGSCMAYMDDDIINHTLYTGEVTLTTASYDVSSVDTLKLIFDYNFHPFEDGGKGDNSSSFAVDVYDGATWKNVLIDDSSTCPWSNVWQSTCNEYADIDISQFIGADLSVRFRYTDGDDGKWTGMIALDNIEIRGSVEAPADITPPTNNENCPDVIVVNSEAEVGDVYEARDLIMTSGPVNVSLETMFAADETQIEAEFSVEAGTVFTVMNEGCN